MPTRVCPYCGEAAGEHSFCDGCGANLRQLARLPTRDEWDAEQATKHLRESKRERAHERRRNQLATSLRIAVPLIVVVVSLGALAIGAAAMRPDTNVMTIPSASMEPTLRAGERITINRDAYDDQAPKRGDLVIFHPPRGAESANECGSGPPPPSQACAAPTKRRASVLFVKRLVAGPGDRVAVREGHIVLNGERQSEPFTAPCGGGEACDFPREVTVPPGHYFVIGDNRGASDDSRFWGPVRRKWIVGRIDDCGVLRLRCSAR